MFGLYKSKPVFLAPEEPIELKTTIDIDRSVDEVYALLDFGDERNQMRSRGNKIDCIADDPAEYRLWYDPLPDHNFLFKVTDAVPSRSYAFTGTIVPPIGRRLRSHEAYTLDKLSDGSCRLTIVNSITHVPGLSEDELADEVGKSSLATARSLTKLKIQAEEGVEAVRQFEREIDQQS